MSRLTKAAEFLFGDNLNIDEHVKKLMDWSPNNVKTLMLGSMLIGVEYFVPCNIGTGFSKYNYGKLGDLDVDLDIQKQGKSVRSVLRVLQGYKPCNNVEEIIICTEMYDRKLLQIDIDLQQISSTDISELFPRLYAITLVDGKSADIFSLLNSASRSELHITDILMKDERFNVNPYYVHKDDWYKQFKLEPELYELDYDSPKPYDPPSKYELYTHFIQAGGVSEAVAKTGFDVLQRLNISYPAIPTQPDALCNFTYSVEEGVLCVENTTKPLPLQRMNSFTGLCTDVTDTFEDYLEGWHRCSELHILGNGAVRLNGVLAKPLLGYDVINRLPVDMQYLLFYKEPQMFQQEMQRKYGRVLVLDADKNEFYKYCKTVAPHWGYFLSLKKTAGLTGLKTLKIDCPYLLPWFKYNFGITEWSDLYTKIPSLTTDGIYIFGVHIRNTNEKQFYDNYEHKINDCIALQSDILKALNLMLPYVPVINKVSNGAVATVAKGVSGLTCKLSSILHRLNTN